MYLYITHMYITLQISPFSFSVGSELKSSWLLLELQGPVDCTGSSCGLSHSTSYRQLENKYVKIEVA